MFLKKALYAVMRSNDIICIVVDVPQPLITEYFSGLCTSHHLRSIDLGIDGNLFREVQRSGIFFDLWTRVFGDFL